MPMRRDRSQLWLARAKMPTLPKTPKKPTLTVLPRPAKPLDKPGMSRAKVAAEKTVVNATLPSATKRGPC